MLVGLISDTHDNLPMIRKALAALADAGVECLIHPGDFVAPFALKAILEFDGPVYGVFGNNDGEHAGLKKLLGDLEKGPRRLTLGGKNITVIHDETKLTDADVVRSDVVVVGHTHAVEIRRGNPLVVNPGDCSGWVAGRNTVATLDTGTLEVKIINLSEL